MNRVICAYLLWLPPLGWLGLHQCYLGRPYHGVWLFTTFAGFFVGWLRDALRIPAYAYASEEIIEATNSGCCCGVYTRICSCICSFICICYCHLWNDGMNSKTGGIPPEVMQDVAEQEDGNEELNQRKGSLTCTQEGEVQKETTVEPKNAPTVVLRSLIEQVTMEQLEEEFRNDSGIPPQKHVIKNIMQKLKLKIDELTLVSLLNNIDIKVLLQKKPISEKEIK